MIKKGENIWGAYSKKREEYIRIHLQKLLIKISPENLRLLPGGLDNH